VWDHRSKSTDDCGISEVRLLIARHVDLTDVELKVHPSFLARKHVSTTTPLWKLYNFCRPLQQILKKAQNCIHFTQKVSEIETYARIIFRNFILLLLLLHYSVLDCCSLFIY
jgi:hypothetical protein